MSGADVIEKRIKAATEGMPSSKACYDKGNGVIIADYLLAYKLEVNVKDSTRDTVCDNLELFIRKVNKPFRDVTRQDVLLFLSSLKKSEDEDPRHKWIGSCNLFSTHIRQFLNGSIIKRIVLHVDKYQPLWMTCLHLGDQVMKKHMIPMICGV